MTCIVPLIPSNHKWDLYEMPEPLNFWVRRTIIEGVEYFRPFERCKRCEFEDFFHFGAHCKGYDINRTVTKNPYSPMKHVIITKEGHWMLK